MEVTEHGIMENLHAHAVFDSLFTNWQITVLYTFHKFTINFN